MDARPKPDLLVGAAAVNRLPMNGDGRDVGGMSSECGGAPVKRVRQGFSAGVKGAERRNA